MKTNKKCHVQLCTKYRSFCSFDHFEPFQSDYHKQVVLLTKHTFYVVYSYATKWFLTN